MRKNGTGRPPPGRQPCQILSKMSQIGIIFRLLLLLPHAHPQAGSPGKKNSSLLAARCPSPGLMDGRLCLCVPQEGQTTLCTGSDCASGLLAASQFTEKEDTVWGSLDLGLLVPVAPSLVCSSEAELSFSPFPACWLHSKPRSLGGQEGKPGGQGC